VTGPLPYPSIHYYGWPCAWLQVCNDSLNISEYCTNDEMVAAELLTRDRDTQALFRALPAEVIELYQHVADKKMIDDTGIHPAHELSDFVCTRPKLVHNGLRRLVYSKFGRRLFRPLLGGRLLSSATFEHAQQVLVGLFGLLMALSPKGLMYRMDLSMAASFGLLVGFAVVFSIALGVTDAPLVHVFLATAAYVVLQAILVVVR
jgi:hypothetical protein